jgi:hypothetical protein
MALALLLALLPVGRALSDEGDALSKLQLHRRRACEAALLWRADLASVDTLDALLSPDDDSPDRVWSIVDGCDEAELSCWSKDNVVVSDGELRLSIGSQIRGKRQQFRLVMRPDCADPDRRHGDAAGARVQLRATADTSGQSQANGILRLGVVAHMPKVKLVGGMLLASIFSHLYVCVSMSYDGA